MAQELWRMSVTDLVALIREKKASVREVIQSHLDRIAAVNNAVNAVTVVLDEMALALADKADQAISKGATLGPLHGVPMTVKENIDLKDTATTMGVPELKDAIALVDAPHIAQLKKAGAIPIGRTNLPDFGLRYHTDNALRGPTKNPWDSKRTPGGSSGGDAAALATGQTPLAMGNDYGGSLRYPSQCCGTVALRPTLGRIPRASTQSGGSPLTLQLFAVHGPMARHISDLRLALPAMSGPDPRDPWWTPAPLQGPDLPQPIKVAVTKNPGEKGIDPHIAEGIDKAATALSDAGYEVEAVHPPLSVEAATLWAQLVFPDVEHLILPEIRSLISEDALRFIELSFQTTQETFDPIQGFADRHHIAKEWNLFLEQYPLILGPVSTAQPFNVGFDVESVETVRQLANDLRLVTPINLLGLPSVAMPVGMANDLPQSVQIIGPRYREDLCLDAAEAVENALGTLTPIDPKP
ncbi:MAG: amidase [bacterium]|nr:amidase [bacterium]